MGLTIVWKPVSGTPQITLNDTVYPVDDNLEFEVEFSDNTVKRMQQGGEWPTFGYPGSCRVVVEGHILGASKADYWSKRMAFLLAMTPPNVEQTHRHHGRLTITDTDATEPYFADCRVVSRSANFEPLSPEVGPFFVTFKAFVPYFYGVASGREYVLG